MRTRPWTFPGLLLLPLAVVVALACGGSGDDQEQAELSEVPTATLPSSLPDPVIVSGTPRPAEGQTYTVQPGDNPSTIAQRFNVSVEALMEANDIVDPTGLVVGQELVIPGAPGQQEVLGATATPRSTPRPTATVEQPDEGEVYIVRTGDIPQTIAAQFGITADELMAANGITDPTSLQVGQELVIPTPRPTPEE